MAYMNRWMADSVVQTIHQTVDQVIKYSKQLAQTDKWLMIIFKQVI